MARNDGAVKKELTESPHLFSARANKDYETMANHANEEFGGALSADDVEEMMRAKESPPKQWSNAASNPLNDMMLTKVGGY